MVMIANGMMPTHCPADFGTPMTSMPWTCAAPAVVDPEVTKQLTSGTLTPGGSPSL